MATELELKLGLLPATAVALDKIGCLAPARRRELGVLMNLYYDTPDEQLRQARVALRIRKSGERWIQTLKTAGRSDASGISQRGEWEWPIEGSGLRPELLTELLPDSIELEQLYPVFSTNFRRTIWELEWQHSQIEVACDQGEIRAGERSSPISELELELKDGDPAALLDLARVIASEVPVWVALRSKAQRGQELKLDRPAIAALPSLQLTDPGPDALLNLAAELTRYWESCYELLPISRDAQLISALISALERLMSVLRQLVDHSAAATLLARYQAFFLRVQPLLDPAYFSGSSADWYQSLQFSHQQRIEQLLADPQPGLLALDTVAFLSGARQ